MAGFIKNVLQQKCPKCKNGDVFQSNGNILALKGPKMNEQCEHCQHKFEKEPGYFIGAMYMSYGLSIVEVVAAFIIWKIIGLPIENFIYVAIIILAALIFFNFRMARMIWMYLL